MGTAALVLLVALGGLAGFVATRPARFRVSRSRTIAAPPAVVHGLIDDFHKWPAWSPWEKRDPALTREYSGSAAGPGASYAWRGNKQVGEGRMTITDSRPPHSITIKLEFIKPFPATNTTQFDFTPTGTGTQVSWTMSGEHSFMGKAFAAFMNMDKMVGPDFEQGLANLDAAATTAAATASS